MSTKLKPCPVPGCRQALRVERIKPNVLVLSGEWRVVCPCGCSGPWSNSRDGALITWNALPRRSDTLSTLFERGSVTVDEPTEMCG